MNLKNYKNKLFIAFSLSVVIFQSCANVGQLKGGPKDTQPPRIVKEKSTPNLQTLFKKQTIVLTFDEWVKLEDVYNQVIVSPPLNESPEVILKGKKLVFEFPKDEVLKENATYTIGFGDAIKDITENNPAKNLRFVFSTGNTIDSLVVTGRVVDAVTGLPTEGVVMMLYDNLDDTVVRKIKPFYFAKTDKEGFAKIENVRAGKYKVFALKDIDLNYMYNQDNEKIGFPDNYLVVSADDDSFLKQDTTVKSDSLQRVSDSIAAANTSLKIRLFEPYKPLKINSKETDRYGVVKLIFNQTVKKADITFDNANQNAGLEYSRDTALVWYNQPDETPWNIYFKGEKSSDTIRVRPRGKTDFMKRGQLSPLGNTATILKSPNLPIQIAFNYPIQKIDTALISVVDTANIKIPLSISLDSASQRTLQFRANWQDGKQYVLKIMPQALTDIYGFKNDTITSKINVLNKKDYGDVIVKIDALDKEKSYICQLTTGSGVLSGEFFIDNKTAAEKRFEYLQPDQYAITIIEDLNKNRIWDTGNYDLKKQPERIFLKKSEEPLRANWDLEIIYTLEK